MNRAIERFFQFSLLGLVSAGFLAVAGSGFLDVPTVVLVCAGLLLRAAHVAGFVRLRLSDLTVNILTLGYIGFFAADYFFVSRGLLEATVHLVCFLAVMKILTARSDRDYLYTASIALVELVAAAMLSLNLNFFAYLAVYLVCAIAAAASAEIRRGLRKRAAPSIAPVRVASRLATTTALMTIGILVLTAAMFILLPRSANATMRRFGGNHRHLSGFSNEVTLGEVGQIQRDSRAVFHVHPYSRQMPAGLKWRGAVLSTFDGHKWAAPAWLGRQVLPRKPPVELADVLQRSRRDGARFTYRVDLNPSDSDALFAAGTAEYLNAGEMRVIRTLDGTLRFSSPPQDVFRYEVSSFVPATGGAELRAPLTLREAQRYLQLPKLDPRIAILARQLGGPANMERYLRTQFGYTLDLPDSHLEDPLGNFLFERRKGHCEYFASALAVMLRTQGVPARLVNGFQSGTFNPVSGLYTVRASDAHSWVEAWLPHSGWTVFDPTPRGIAPEPSRFSFYLDAAETFWQEWVLSYDLNRQITIAERLQESSQQVAVNWKPEFHWTPLYTKRLLRVGGLAIVLALIGLIRPYRRRADPDTLYGRMLRLLDVSKPPSLTPVEFANSLPPSPMSDAVRLFTERHQAFRYGDSQTAARDLSKLYDKMSRMKNNRRGVFRARKALLWFTLTLCLAAFAASRPADILFEKHTIDLGANEPLATADINRDGIPDLVSGENWFEGPNWIKHKFRSLNYTQNYIEDFSDLPLDVNGDGYPDIVSCTWFAKKLWWNENPGKRGGDWKEHPIETGHNVEFAFLVDLDNDGKAEEVLPQFGALSDPLAYYKAVGGTFEKHVVSPNSFGHGIGAGDVNRDGKTDIVTPKGWLEAPDWKLHPEFDLGQTGFIYVLDVNGDGLPDLVTSMAHDYGIFWLEQKPDHTWTKHMIDDSWSQPHAMTMVDLNGDGRMDFVTGKRFMAHNGRDPGEREPLGIYWYEYFKNDAGQIEWAKHVIDYSTRTGAGMQVVAADLNRDGALDIAVAGKSGVFLFTNLAGKAK